MAEGWSDTKDATEETQKICDQVQGQVEVKTGKCYKDFKAVKYRNQVVEGGENFLIKVHVGGEEYDHLRVSRAIVFPPDTLPLVLIGVQQNKTKDAPLVPFTN